MNEFKVVVENVMVMRFVMFDGVLEREDDGKLVDEEVEVSSFEMFIGCVRFSIYFFLFGGLLLLCEFLVLGNDEEEVLNIISMS